MIYEEDETFTVSLRSPSGATLADDEATGTITNDEASPTLSIAPSTVSVEEGDSGSAAKTFTVTMSLESSRQVTVNYATADGSATAGTDYAAASGALTFAAGETSKTLTVQVNGDALYEPDETFTVTLSEASGSDASISAAAGTATVTIDDDDVMPALSIMDASVAEGDSGTTVMEFRVTLTPSSNEQVTVSYATSDGTATAGTDYTAASGTLTFASGTTMQTVNVSTIGDTVDERNETFTVTLSSPVGATLGDAEATGTIKDLPSLSVTVEGTGSVPESRVGSGTQYMRFVVTLDRAYEEKVWVDYAPAEDLSTASVRDYARGTRGRLEFRPGERGIKVLMMIRDDSEVEDDETVVFRLSNPVNATLAKPEATGTIIDDDRLRTLSIAEASVAEGDSGSVGLSFTVTLTPSSVEQVTVNYATADGTATAGTDYTAASGTLTFAAGTTKQTVNVLITGDTVDERNETFTVTLSSPVGATLGDAEATGTIKDLPSLSVTVEGTGSVTETRVGSGIGRQQHMRFLVTLDRAYEEKVWVDYAPVEDLGTASVRDYDRDTRGRLEFRPGERGIKVLMTIWNDSEVEDDETVVFRLSNPVNATLAKPEATGTIIDDDRLPTLSIAEASVAEGDSGSVGLIFTATLTPSSVEQVAVNYATADGTATAGTDYTAASGTLTFAAGTTKQTFSVTITGDVINENDETFAVTLSSPSGATLADAEATGTITNDDAMPILNIMDASVAEGDSGTTEMEFTVTLTSSSNKQVTVSYATSDGTASSNVRAGADYMAVSGTLTFASGTTMQTVNVSTIGDTVDEQNETFTVTLSSPVGATLGDAEATGTIKDLPSLSVTVEGTGSVPESRVVLAHNTCASW